MGIYGNDDGAKQADHAAHVDSRGDDYAPPPGSGRVIVLEEAVLARNARFAEENRRFYEGRRILAVNFTSAPGAGGTTLLEHMILDLAPELRLSVVEGDQATDNDVRRIRALGCHVVRVSTAYGERSLDAEQVGRAVRALKPPPGSVVFIENVGRVARPTTFDLGESVRIAVLSVTEGDDMPNKNPLMFRAAEALILTRTDLLPQLEFDVALCISRARSVNPALRIFQVSARTGDGLPRIHAWLRRELAHAGE